MIYRPIIGCALTLSVLASAALAQSPPSRDQVDRARAAAVRECSKESAAYTQAANGLYQLYSYRACMAQHGQPE
jgi:hypothetical protein